jgi:hypothetical protein
LEVIIRVEAAKLRLRSVAFCATYFCKAFLINYMVVMLSL